MKASEYKPYDRDRSYIPRVAAVHDLCGYGKCSLGVAIPVLSAGGCDVCPVPTSLFSSHTLYDTWTMHDTTDMLPEYLSAWEKIGVDIDAVYSGFLGSAEQVAIIKRLYETYPAAMRLVDPVMGDAGKPYPTYTPELCQAMVELVDGADVLTPNLTEAAIITNTEYQGQNVTEDFVKRIIDHLIEAGAKNVVIKGIELGDGKVRNYLAGVDCDLDYTTHELLPFKLHGTGDLFCSALIASIMAGRDLFASTQFAGELVHDAMLVTKNQPEYELRGVSFELVLGKVSALLF